MDNNTPSLLGGTDLEAQDSLQQSNEPAPLVYDPTATIVYNASESYYGTEKPQEIDAYEISRQVRNSNVRSEQVLKFQAMIADVEILLKDTLKEVSDSEWINFIKEVAQALNIRLTRTLTISATVDHTITVEIDIDEDEPSEYDFSADVSLDGYTVEDHDHYVRDFDVTDED